MSNSGSHGVRRAERRPLVGSIYGSLIHGATRKAITCLSIDASARGMGVMTKERLTVGETLLLVIQGREIPLEVVWTQAGVWKGDELRYGLRLVREEDNLDEFFSHYRRENILQDDVLYSPHRAALVNGSSVRATRFELAGSIRAHVKTLGTTTTFAMEAEDISKSGLFVSARKSANAPFTENTLVELSIDPDGTCFDSPVSCLGRVVRRAPLEATAGEPFVGFGIQIIEIFDRDLEAWETGVSRVTERFVQKGQPFEEKAES
jgi:hypothetical protein